VERAKGILQRKLGISEEDAYFALQRQSRQRRKPMKEVAEAIVLSDEVRRGQPQVARVASNTAPASE
jgi:AmiR/NasT family two-component response regulator